jgi:muramoyltetrapeptide carboxypeptidase
MASTALKIKPRLRKRGGRGNQKLKKAFDGAFEGLSRVSIISSSFAVPESELKLAIAYWAQRNVLLKKPVGVKRKKDILCAHSLDSRLLELKKAFSAEETSDFVWAVRGGYGFQELIPKIKKQDFGFPKIFMGFSDSTSLHYFLNKTLGVPSLHSPHPNWFAKNKNRKISNEISSFFEDPQAFSPVFKGLKRLNVSPVQSLAAKIVGGNLTTLISVIGTKEDQGAKSNILFLEDLEEPAYKINRMLEHLSQSGFLKGVRAVVFGHLSHSSTSQEKLIKAVVKRWAMKQGFPVLSGMRAGHVHDKNHPFWLGKKSRLVLDEKPRLLNNI